MTNKKGKIKKRNKYIEILDDNKILTDILKLYLQDDFRVKTFNDYDDALKHLEKVKKRPDIFLVDILLGKNKTGIDFAREIEKYGVKIIYFTGCAKGDPIYKSAQMTGAIILEKPISLEEIKDVLNGQ